MHSLKASYNQTLKPVQILNSQNFIWSFSRIHSMKIFKLTEYVRLSRRECVSSLELKKKTIWVYII